MLQQYAAFADRIAARLQRMQIGFFLFGCNRDYNLAGADHVFSSQTDVPTNLSLAARVHKYWRFLLGSH